MEGRVSSDQDLKLGDTLRYYQRDSHAAKALLVRRLRCLSAYETANRNLEKARVKNKDVHGVSLYDIHLNASISFKLSNSCTYVAHLIKRIYLFKNESAAFGSARGIVLNPPSLFHIYFNDF